MPLTDKEEERLLYFFKLWLANADERDSKLRLILRHIPNNIKEEFYDNIYDQMFENITQQKSLVDTAQRDLLLSRRQGRPPDTPGPPE